MLLSESGSDHFSDLEEEASEVLSQAKREASPGERGLLDISVPEVMQGAEPEELLSEESFLGDFEREYLHLPLNEALPELQSAQSPTRKRGQPVNESTDLQQAVRSRTSSRFPSPRRFNFPPRCQPRTPAGRGAFKSPLRIGARGRHSPGERGVCAECLFLPPRPRLSIDQQGRARSLQIQRQLSQTLCSFPYFPSGGLRRVRANRSKESATHSNLGGGKV
jgi:hypothetical protein